MDDFKAMAKVLAAVKGGEGLPVFNMALVSKEALAMPETERDKAALRLYENGYIDGLQIIDGIDRQRAPFIYWPGAKPSVTLKGLEYMEECKPLKRAFKALRDTGTQIAAQVIANEIEKLGK